MSNEELESLKIISDKRRTYYSLEIYPPEMYDPDTIVKTINVGNVTETNITNYIDTIIPLKPIVGGNEDLIRFDSIPVLTNLDYSEGEINNRLFNSDMLLDPEDSNNELEYILDPEYVKFKKQSRENKLKLAEILFYIKGDWLRKGKEDEEDMSKLLPFYKYENWESIDYDMVRLSNQFKGWIFAVYGKSEFFVDNLWVKMFRNGRTEHSSNRIEFEIRLRMPNGSLKKVDKNGQLILSPDYDVTSMLMPSNKGFADMAHLATDLTVLVGKTVADFGSLAAEAAVAARVLSIGLSIVDEMHQNVIRYSENKGKSKFLYDRCRSILTTLQLTPASTLDIQSVALVIQKLKEANELIAKYNKNWRVTKWLSSKKYKRNFDDIHGDINSAMLDFGVSYSVGQKIFTYKEDIN